MAFPRKSPGRHAEIGDFGAPYLTCVYPCLLLRPGSFDPRRQTRGQDGFAKPFLYGSRIRCSMPVYPGAFDLSPFLLAEIC